MVLSRTIFCIGKHLSECQESLHGRGSIDLVSSDEIKRIHTSFGRRPGARSGARIETKCKLPANYAEMGCSEAEIRGDRSQSFHSTQIPRRVERQRAELSLPSRINEVAVELGLGETTIQTYLRS